MSNIQDNTTVSLTTNGKHRMDSLIGSVRPEFIVMGQLYNSGGMTPRQIADITRMPMQRVVGILRVLESHKYVQPIQTKEFTT